MRQRDKSIRTVVEHRSFEAYPTLEATLAPLPLVRKAALTARPARLLLSCPERAQSTRASRRSLLVRSRRALDGRSGRSHLGESERRDATPSP